MNQFIQMDDIQLNNYAFNILYKLYGYNCRLTYKRFCKLWEVMEFLAFMQAGQRRN